MRLRAAAAAALVTLLPLAASCAATDSASAPAAAPSGAAAGCITDFDAGTDYFPDKAAVTDATNFSISYHRSYKVVTVPQPTPGAKPISYVLVQCGAPAPELTGDLANAPRITVPVARVAASSATQIAYFELLDRLDALVAVDDTSDLVSEAANARVQEGAITAFGGASGYDIEKIVAAKPDLVLEGGMADDTWTKLAELKIPTAAGAAWLEPTPLGRAEWISFYAAFLGAEKKASEVYGQISSDYAATKKAVANASGKPSVLVGTEYKGTWTVPTKGSYVAALVNDAGGDYVFGDVDGSGTTKMDQEKILTTGATAKIWLNGNWMSKQRWATTADALAANPKVAVLASVKDGQIWNPTKRIAANGGNDFWESGTVRPDLVLKDLAIIVHPGAVAGETYYYQQLPQ